MAPVRSKAAMPIGMIGASPLPATARSIRPMRIMSKAWPMQSAPVAQAEIGVADGPVAPRSM